MKIKTGETNFEISVDESIFLSDADIPYNDDSESYILSADDYMWWSSFFVDYRVTQQKLDNLRSQLDYDQKHQLDDEIIKNVDSRDLSTLNDRINFVIDNF